MNTELAYGILDIFQTMQEAVEELKKTYEEGDIDTFKTISGDLLDGLNAVMDAVKYEALEENGFSFCDACTCGIESLKDIHRLAIKNSEKVIWKLEYELDSILETIMTQFYYWEIVNKCPEKREEFLAYLENTKFFRRLKKSKKEWNFDYDLIIMVTAYNKLDYTKQCVESILENLPKGIKYRFVLLNHGSSDATRDYFENMENIDVINIAINNIMPTITLRISAIGRYFLHISNDIIVGKNAIKNLYRCISEHDDYAYVVPSTCAVSNLQMIPVNYETLDEFRTFTLKNNKYDENKHEQRVRLCNPVEMVRTVAWLEMLWDMYEEITCNKNSFSFSFPDDKISLWMRRNGYKCILAKDAYCHHFGSLTIKEEIQKIQSVQAMYIEGRKTFFARYGIDPWGTGFCYDLELFNNWDFPCVNKATVLGVNCGMGSNSLKVKELLKERGAEDIVLHNATQEGRYLYDLQGISDEAFLFWNLRDMINKTGIKKYNYIVVDEPIQGDNGQDSLQKVIDAGLQFDELAWRTPNGDWQIVK